MTIMPTKVFESHLRTVIWEAPGSVVIGILLIIQPPGK